MNSGNILRKVIGRSVCLQPVAVVAFFMAVCSILCNPVGKSSPIIGPEFISFNSIQPVTLIYQPLSVIQPQNTLPARQGTDFEGPDPGLNANIIGGSDCPNNYRRDSAGICRLEFVYGPNPFSAIIPQTFKGSLQFYMGLQVGNTRTNLVPRRRFPFRIRGRPRNRNKTRVVATPPPVVILHLDDDDD